ncbi:hypothetical protein DMC63_26875 [Streptomyces sp. WAC 05977]|nr:hypothetical protein DMC63_26875 [Streptomyces sp. WAC 05977]
MRQATRPFVLGGTLLVAGVVVVEVLTTLVVGVTLVEVLTTLVVGGAVTGGRAGGAGLAQATATKHDTATDSRSRTRAMIPPHPPSNPPVLGGKAKTVTAPTRGEGRPVAA